VGGGEVESGRVAGEVDSELHYDFPLVECYNLARR
jgi:hypothetical protein